MNNYENLTNLIEKPNRFAILYFFNVFHKHAGGRGFGTVFRPKNNIENRV